MRATVHTREIEIERVEKGLMGRGIEEEDRLQGGKEGREWREERERARESERELERKRARERPSAKPSERAREKQ
eukprot:2941046-Pleurochrysis_carterae.AAC.1